MTDRVSPLVRARMMSAIRAKDTRPELLVRRYLHGTGLRFRLHDRGLPGTPDLSFPASRLAVFVNGCFWHQHPGCPHAAVPTANREFWATKFAANKARDAAKTAQLTGMGWTVFTVWECEAADEQALDSLAWALRAYMSEGGQASEA